MSQLLGNWTFALLMFTAKQGTFKYLVFYYEISQKIKSFDI